MVTMEQKGELKDFFPEVVKWVQRTRVLRSVILFGSNARPSGDDTPRSRLSDFDLHVVASDPRQMELVNWERELSGLGYCFQTVRPATGGVRKVTAVFRNAQLDMVIVPEWTLQFVRLALKCRLHRKISRLELALNELATCLHSGYQFIKGERAWGKFFGRISAEMPGVRLSDHELFAYGQVFLSDLLWVFQKIERGELIAAQYCLHARLVETNLRLIRELRLRRGNPLPSFGLGRRLEMLAVPNQLKWVQINARLNSEELHNAAWQCLAGLKSLMAELNIDWRISGDVNDLLTRHASILRPPM